MREDDQRAVQQAIIEAGNAPGRLRVSCGVTDDETAVYIECGEQSAYFTPSETKELLMAVCEQADLNGWLHNDETLWLIAYGMDLADVVDNTSDVTKAEIDEKWRGFSPSRYDWEADPDGLRDAIMRLHVEYEEL